MPDACEHVVERPIRRLGEADAIGGNDRHVKRRREIDERVVVGFLVAQQVALQLPRTRSRAPKMPTMPIDEAADAEAAAAQRRAADERDEPAGVAVELVERERAFPFRRAQFHPRHQAAEIAIAVRAIRRGQAARNDRGRGRRSPMVSSAPMIALMPARLAARWNRGAP